VWLAGAAGLTKRERWADLLSGALSGLAALLAGGLVGRDLEAGGECGGAVVGRWSGGGWRGGGGWFGVEGAAKGAG
jgi:hypothetical protein